MMMDNPDLYILLMPHRHTITGQIKAALKKGGASASPDLSAEMAREISTAWFNFLQNPSDTPAVQAAAIQLVQRGLAYVPAAAALRALSHTTLKAAGGQPDYQVQALSLLKDFSDAFLEQIAVQREEQTWHEREQRQTSPQQTLSDTQQQQDLSRDVERRAALMQATVEVGRAITSILDTNQLLNQIVHLIIDRLDFYYAAIFTIDQTGQWAMLTEAAGPQDSGALLKARGHKLEIGGQSMVGAAIARRKARIALDTGTEAVRFNNPLLPETRSEIALPLIVGDQILGALDVQSRRSGAFDELNTTPLQGMADQIAVALENARLFEQTQTALQETQNLNRATFAIVGATQVQEVCQNVAAYFNDLVRAYRTNLFLIDNQRKQVTVKAKHGYFPTNLEEMTYEVLNAGLTGMVLRSGKPILSVSADDGIEPTETIEQRKLNHIGALIVVPITVKGEVIGTVTTLNQDDGRLFTQHDVDLLMSLAAQTSQAIENVRLLEQTQIARRQAEARVQEMDILNRVSSQVSSTLDLNQVLDTLCAVLVEEMKFTSIQLNLIDPISRTVQIARALGLAQGRQGLVRPLAEMQNDILLDIARKGQLEVIDGPDERFDREIYEREEHTALVRAYVPLRLQDETIGVLEVGYQRDERAMITDHDTRLLNGLADQLALAVNNTRLFEQTQSSEERLRLIVETVSIPILISDLTDGTALFANTQVGRTFGLPPEDLVGRQTPDYYVNPADRLVLIEKMKQEGRLRDYEVQLKKADGTPFWVWLSMQPIVFAGRQALLAAFYDVTERKQAEDNLARERNLLRILIDHLPDYVYAKDAQARFTIVNRQMALNLGKTDPAEFIGKDDFDFFSHELAATHYADDMAIMQSGRPLLNKEEQNIEADGRTRWLLTTKVPLIDSEGEVFGLVGVGIDTTERKQTEMERERLLAEQQKRAVQLQTVAEVSRVAQSILSLDELLPQAANLVRERFDLYYVGIFLVDESNAWAVLRAGTGEAGQQMLRARHRLRVGSSSMIGSCIVNQQARIALDVGGEAIRFNNPLLPDTRSEIALPLISRGRAIGAVTIQSAQPAAFSQEDMLVFQTLADQLTVAAENARLFEETRGVLDELDAINRRLTGEAWSEFLHGKSREGMLWTTTAKEPTLAPVSANDRVASTGQIKVEPNIEKAEAKVTVPIVLRGQSIGALQMRMPIRDWNDDLQTITVGVVGHLAQSIENARLIEQTERTAQREKDIAVAADKIHRASDMESVLRTAVEEVSRITGATDVGIRLGNDTSPRVKGPDPEPQIESNRLSDA